MVWRPAEEVAEVAAEQGDRGDDDDGDEGDHQAVLDGGGAAVLAGLDAVGDEGLEGDEELQHGVAFRGGVTGRSADCLACRPVPT
jgi:hypothetical protein